VSPLQQQPGKILRHRGAQVLEEGQFFNGRQQRGAQYNEGNPLFWKVGAVIAFLLATFEAGLDLPFMGLSVLERRLQTDEAQLNAMLTILDLPLYFAGRWMMRLEQRLSRAIKMILDASKRRV